jgi:glycosyltransferase involved in cell wall biosynthesis
MMSPSEPFNLSIIIPAFNEEANIALTVEEAISHLGEDPQLRVQFILVDDGSTDGTSREMRSLASRFPQVTVLRHEMNRGLGAAIYSGMAKASGDWISWLPADGQIPPENVTNVLRAVSDDAIVILRRPERQRSFGRRFLTAGFHLVVRAMISDRYHRYSGVFLVPRELMASLKLVANTAVQNVAVIEYAVFQGARVVAVEGTLRPRTSGVSKVANTKTTLQTLFETLTMKRKIKPPAR